MLQLKCLVLLANSLDSTIDEGCQLRQGFYQKKPIKTALMSFKKIKNGLISLFTENYLPSLFVYFFQHFFNRCFYLRILAI